MQKLIFASIVFALTLLGSASAADKAATLSDVEKLQEQVRTLDKEVAVQREAFIRKLDDVEKRRTEIAAEQANSLAAISVQTGAVGNYIGITSFLVTVLLIVGGILTYRGAKIEAKATAQETAEDASKKWFDKSSDELNKRILELEQKAVDAEKKMNDIVSSVQTAANSSHVQIEEIIKRANQLLSGVATQRSDEDNSRELTRAINKFKNENTADNASAVNGGDQTTISKSYYFEGLENFVANNYHDALKNFQAAVDSVAGNESTGDYLFAKAATQEALRNEDDAINTLLSIERSFEDEASQPMRDLVNRALVKKALLYCKQGPKGQELEMAAFHKLDQRLNEYRPVAD